jgi:hypothetical protein
MYRTRMHMPSALSEQNSGVGLELAGVTEADKPGLVEQYAGAGYNVELGVCVERRRH